MKRLNVLLGILVIAMLLVTACQPKATETPTEAVTAPTTPPVEAPTTAPEATQPVEPTAPTGEAPLKLIMVQHALCAWDAFWCTVEEGITTAAEDMGVEVTILGPDK